MFQLDSFLADVLELILLLGKKNGRKKRALNVRTTAWLLAQVERSGIVVVLWMERDEFGENFDQIRIIQPSALIQK